MVYPCFFLLYLNVFCGLTVSLNANARRNVMGNPVKTNLTSVNLLSVTIRIHGLEISKCVVCFLICF